MTSTATKRTSFWLGCKLLVCSLLAASPAQGEPPSAKDSCRSISELAKMVMNMRQAGMPIERAMDGLLPADSEYASDPVVGPLVESLIMTAYRRPLAYTDEAKETAATEFGNQAYLECYTGK